MPFYAQPVMLILVLVLKDHFSVLVLVLVGLVLLLVLVGPVLVNISITVHSRIKTSRCTMPWVTGGPSTPFATIIRQVKNLFGKFGPAD